MPMYCTVWSPYAHVLYSVVTICPCTVHVVTELLLKVKDLEELVELMKKDTERLESEAVETNRVLCKTKEVIHHYLYAGLRAVYC